MWEDCLMVTLFYELLYKTLIEIAEIVLLFIDV